MSTDKQYTSCQTINDWNNESGYVNVSDGANSFTKKHVINGALVAYLMPKTKNDIKHSLSRMNIIPYFFNYDVRDIDDTI